MFAAESGKKVIKQVEKEHSSGCSKGMKTREGRGVSWGRLYRTGQDVPESDGGEESNDQETR